MSSWIYWSTRFSMGLVVALTVAYCIGASCSDIKPRFYIILATPSLVSFMMELLYKEQFRMRVAWRALLLIHFLGFIVVCVVLAVPHSYCLDGLLWLLPLWGLFISFLVTMGSIMMIAQ